jgi:PAS domain S-box-containing protein
MWPKFVKREDRYKLAITAVLLAIASILVCYFHIVLKKETPYSHFFYIPVVLACLWWKWKGLIVAVFSSGYLILSHIFFRQGITTTDIYLHAVMFIVIGLAVTVLSKHTARVEKALREGEKRFRSLVETTSDWIWEVDVNGVYTYASPKVKDLIGREPEEVLGKTAFDLMPPDEAKRVSLLFADIVKSGKPFTTLENTILDKNGRAVVVETSGVPIVGEGGNLLGYRGIDRDITERKQSEKALHDSEEIYRTLVENIGLGVTLIGADYRIIMTNATQGRLFKKSRDKFLGEYCFREFEKRDAVCSHCPGKRAMTTGRPAEVETEGVRDDGSRFPVCIHAFPVYEADGKIKGFIEVVEDVTEQKKAMRALEESEKRYKMLFDRAAEGIIVADIKTMEFRYANPAICRMLGYSEQELTSMGVADVHPKESMERVFAEFEAQARGERVLASEIPCLRKDGRIIYADISATNIVIDGVNCNVGFFTDITDRVRAEEQLRRARDELEERVEQRTADLARVNEDLLNQISEREIAENACRVAEERFRHIFENALVGIYRTTPDGRILMANPAMVKMLGYSSFEQLAKINLEREGFEPAYPRSFFKEEIEKDDSVRGLEYIWIKRDRTRLYVRESAVAVRDDEGKVVYYEGTVEDITERKKAEKKLMDYQKQLRSLALELSLSEEKVRRQMATSVHDHLGQNLAISKIKLDSLQKSVSSPELVGIVNEVRDLLGQTIESARSLTFELSPPVLYELGFEAAVEWLVRYVKKRDGLSAEFRNDGKDKPLNDKVRVLLFQSVRESLHNVTKHAHAKNVTVSVCRADDEIQVTVVDDGIGFDVSKIRSGGLDGGGFGLFSISERLENIGGRFSIESKPRGGTRVFLAAPISKKRGNKRGKKK